VKQVQDERNCNHRKSLQSLKSQIWSHCTPTYDIILSGVGYRLLLICGITLNHTFVTSTDSSELLMKRSNITCDGLGVFVTCANRDVSYMGLLICGVDTVVKV
jgi:hypothetical protein